MIFKCGKCGEDVDVETVTCPACTDKEKDMRIAELHGNLATEKVAAQGCEQENAHLRKRLADLKAENAELAAEIQEMVEDAAGEDL